MEESAHFGDDSGFTPILILDSITYLLKSLQLTKTALKNEAATTFKEGLSSGDILGALHHTLLAEQFGVAIIGVVNSQLLPTVGMLGGAVEGEMFSNGAGQLRHVSRGTGRREVSFSLDAESVDYALATLGINNLESVSASVFTESVV